MDVSTITTTGDNTLLQGVRAILDDADEALLTVAFVQAAGVHLLRRQLDRLGTSTRLVLTTTFTANPEALHLAHGLGTAISILNPGSGTYHPKVYLGRRGQTSFAIIGSANLTGGLVSNIEAAVMLRGTLDDSPIKAAWEFAEAQWQHQRCVRWTPTAMPVTPETFSPELYDAIQSAVVAAQGMFTTIANGKPNRVTEITPTGIYVETEASQNKRNPPQRIPAWMFQLAYDYLRMHGRLTNRYPLATDGLNVKRSSGVIAILAKLPGVTATTTREDGITLTWNAPSSAAIDERYRLHAQGTALAAERLERSTRTPRRRR